VTSLPCKWRVYPGSVYRLIYWRPGNSLKNFPVEQQTIIEVHFLLIFTQQITAYQQHARAINMEVLRPSSLSTSSFSCSCLISYFETWHFHTLANLKAYKMVARHTRTSSTWLVMLMLPLPRFVTNVLCCRMVLHAAHATWLRETGPPIRDPGPGSGSDRGFLSAHTCVQRGCSLNCRLTPR